MAEKRDLGEDARFKVYFLKREEHILHPQWQLQYQSICGSWNIISCNPVPGYFFLLQLAKGRLCVGDLVTRRHHHTCQSGNYRCGRDAQSQEIHRLPLTTLHIQLSTPSARLVHGPLSQKQKLFWRCLPALPGRQPLSRIWLSLIQAKPVSHFL